MTMTEVQEYILFIYTENRIGLLNRISLIFTRRHVNIESISASESEMKGVYRYTVVIYVTLRVVKLLILQIEKQVEVLRASYHTPSQTIYQEIALYKLPISLTSNETSLEQIIRDSNASILTVTKEYFIIEKTGHKSETQKLLDKLKPFGVTEFVRSGRVSSSKSLSTITERVSDLDHDQDHSYYCI